MKTKDIEKVLNKLSTAPSKWELDNVVYYDRASNPQTLTKFLKRIQHLESQKDQLNFDERTELSALQDLLEELDLEDCKSLITRTDDDARLAFIEDLARTSAIEVLTGGKISYETMNTACKLSPSDFILCAKRTQDLINAIQGLVVKGETLSTDVAGT